MAIWSGKEVAKFVSFHAPIKINPNGVDIGVSEIWKIDKNAEATIHNKQRELSIPKMKIEPKGEFWELDQGLYEIRLANEIAIPQNATGLTLPRSTFNRLGVIKSESAIWDSGYRGFGTQTIFVAIKKLRVHINEKWFQLIFLDNKENLKEKYTGYWQGEKPNG
ncbi:MAG: hypothetical protein QXQ79_02455 [Candidatus Nanoarchaeia archaeon]